MLIKTHLVYWKSEPEEYSIIVLPALVIFAPIDPGALLRLNLLIPAGTLPQDRVLFPLVMTIVAGADIVMKA